MRGVVARVVRPQVVGIAASRDAAVIVVVIVVVVIVVVVIGASRRARWDARRVGARARSSSRQVNACTSAKNIPSFARRHFLSFVCINKYEGTKVSNYEGIDTFVPS